MESELDGALRQFERVMHKRGAAERTVVERLRIVRKLGRTLPLLGTPGTVRQTLMHWRAELQRAYEENQLGPSSVRAQVAALCAFYDALPTYATDNPARTLAMGKPAPWKPRPLAMPEVDRLFAQATSVQEQAILGLLLNGFRRIEVCRLRTNHLRYDAREHTMVAQVLGKGNKVADVALHPETGATLARHLLDVHGSDVADGWMQELAAEQMAKPYVTQAEQRLYELEVPMLAFDRLKRKRLEDRELPIFSLYHGKPLRHWDVNTLFTRLREAAQLPKYTSAAGVQRNYGPHSLRHTCATELLEAGVDSAIVQEILRHSNPTTTAMYMQVRLGPKAAAMRRLKVRT